MGDTPFLCCFFKGVGVDYSTVYPGDIYDPMCVTRKKRNADNDTDGMATDFDAQEELQKLVDTLPDKLNTTIRIIPGSMNFVLSVWSIRDIHDLL